MTKRELASFTDLEDECVEKIFIDDRNVFVKIKTADYANFIQFSASLSGKSPDTLDTISFNVRTKDAETGQRHPYFQHRRPADLAARAIRHFDQNFSVKSLNFTWTKVFGPPEGQSDNYTAYIDTLNRLRDSMPIQNAQRQALLATWTIQKVAIPNGFTLFGELHEVVQEDDTVNSPTEVRGTMLRA